jgi:nitrogen fixation NifU-like protein
MTEMVKNKRREEVERLFQRFRSLVAGELENRSELGKLEVFAGVREFPMRVKCATLVWHALSAALRELEQGVSTE